MTQTHQEFQSAADLSSAVVVVADPMNAANNRTYRAVAQFATGFTQLALDNHSLKMEAHEEHQRFVAKGKFNRKYGELENLTHGLKAGATALKTHEHGLDRLQGLNNRTSLRAMNNARTPLQPMKKPEAKPVEMKPAVKTAAAPTMTIASTQAPKPKRPDAHESRKRLMQCAGYIHDLVA